MPESASSMMCISFLCFPLLSSVFFAFSQESSMGTCAFTYMYIYRCVVILYGRVSGQRAFWQTGRRSSSGAGLPRSQPIVLDLGVVQLLWPPACSQEQQWACIAKRQRAYLQHSLMPKRVRSGSVGRIGLGHFFFDALITNRSASPR